MPVSTKSESHTRDYLQELQILYRQGKKRDALSLLEQKLHQEPENPGLLKLMGYFLREEGDFIQAEKYLHRSLRICVDAEGFYLLGEIYNCLGQFHKALEYHLKALEVDPSFADIVQRNDTFCPPYQEERVSSCFICGDSDRDIVWVGNQSRIAKNYGVIHPIRTWVQCNTCGLIYADPRPTEEAVRQWWACYQAERKRPSQWKYLKDDSQMASFIQEAQKRLIILESQVKGRTLLDVGAGVGIFVAVCLESGWEVTGVELMDQAVSVAYHYNLPVQQGDFLKVGFPHEFFDVVTLWEVIEHLHDPRPFLQKIWNLLRPGGILALSTPNPESAWVRFKGPFWHLWMEPTHLYCYSLRVLQRLLTEMGFQVVRWMPSPRAIHGIDMFARKKI